MAELLLEQAVDMIKSCDGRLPELNTATITLMNTLATLISREQRRRSSAVFPPKTVISARACIVCGRDDRSGERRKKGFKCRECIGIPSNNRYLPKVEQHDQLLRHRTNTGETVINSMRIVGRLGRGSHGRVMLAEHVTSHQQYAVKELLKGPGFHHTVYEEVRVMKSLNHPNIIRVYSVFDDPSSAKLYLIMEYLEGGQVLHLDATGEGEAIEVEKLKKYVVGIAQGLQYLHNKGIVHRDIKPQNILLDKHDNVKLTDFGVSHFNSTEGVSFSTATAGSPAFLPPEEYLGHPVNGQLQDIWAFGVTLFAMAFSTLPFRGASFDEVQQSVLHAELAFPPSADPALLDLLRRMLQREPSERATISTVLNHPFISDVRIVKGYSVETRTAKIVVAESEDVANEECDLVLVCPPQAETGGIERLRTFLREGGPTFQVVGGGAYSATLLSVKRDPRRLQLRDS